MSPAAVGVRHRGFTLIEVLVVMAVLGILAAVAIPNYTRYIQRGNLVEGTNALAEHRVRMEQFYQDNRTYSDGGICPLRAAPTNTNTFTFACVLANGGQTFTTTATGRGNVNGFVFTINQNNQRATTAIPSSWGSLPSDAGTRWVTK